MNELLIVDKQLTPEEKPSIKREMEIIEDDSFNYDGYQVVRGEFFSHLYEPCITFNNFKVYMNTACIKNFPKPIMCRFLSIRRKRSWLYALVPKNPRTPSVGAAPLRSAHLSRLLAVSFMERSRS